MHVLYVHKTITEAIELTTNFTISYLAKLSESRYPANYIRAHFDSSVNKKYLL